MQGFVQLSELLRAEPERALVLPDAVGSDARHFKLRVPTRTGSGIHVHLAPASSSAALVGVGALAVPTRVPTER